MRLVIRQHRRRASQQQPRLPLPARRRRRGLEDAPVVVDTWPHSGGEWAGCDSSAYYRSRYPNRNTRSRRSASPLPPPGRLWPQSAPVQSMTVLGALIQVLVALVRGARPAPDPSRRSSSSSEDEAAAAGSAGCGGPGSHRLLERRPARESPWLKHRPRRQALLCLDATAMTLPGAGSENRVGNENLDGLGAPRCTLSAFSWDEA